MVRSRTLFVAPAASSWIPTGEIVWIEIRPIYPSVYKTWVVVAEDELLKLSLLPDDVPITIELSAGCKDPLDYEILRRLSKDLAGMFNGITIEPVK